MNPTVECPHSQVAAARTCPGCTFEQDGITPGLRFCEGMVGGRVYRDSEGDAGVIGGINSFLAVEDVVLSCGCTLDDGEQEQVEHTLVEEYEFPSH